MQSDISKFSVCLSNDENHRGVLVRLFGKHLQKRRPVNLTLVIDVSGSMARQATMPSTNGSTETYAFTLLDIVKHACRAVCEQMGENDVLSLVSFSSSAQVVFAPQVMNADGRSNFSYSLNCLEPTDMTNLFAGISKGASTLRTASEIAHADALHQLIVLTDGESNVAPAIGNVRAVEKLYQENVRDGFVFTMNTLALGFNDMQSPELAELAWICNKGGFTYIPDMGMVGSVFVNLVSSIFSTVEQNIMISVNDNVDAPQRTVVPLLQSGQTVDVWMPVQSVDQVDIIVDLPNPCPEQQIETRFSPADFMRAHANSVLLAALREKANLNIPPTNPEQFIFPAWCNQAKDLPIFIDMQTEGVKALLPQYYAKWGRHYLQSLHMAHRRAVCNNFKDTGVQLYATDFFSECQAAGDAAFNRLPPPAPNPSCRSGLVVTCSSSLNSQDNPCVSGTSLVTMADGSKKLAQDIVKGDVVRTENVTVDGAVVNTATIECVLKTICANSQMSMCALPTGLVITPYHPVAMAPLTTPLTFKFPNVLVTPTVVGCSAVYSFLFKQTDKPKTMIIQGTHVIVLGSNYEGNGVAKHPFFTSWLTVSAALRRFKGWASGLITVNSNPMTRDSKTRLVNGFDYSREIFDAVAAAKLTAESARLASETAAAKAAAAAAAAAAATAAAAIAQHQAQSSAALAAAAATAAAAAEANPSAANAAAVAAANNGHPPTPAPVLPSTGSPPTNTAPTTPAPTTPEPATTESAPEPAPTESAPEPAPTESAPTESAPTETAPEPAPTTAQV